MRAWGGLLVAALLGGCVGGGESAHPTLDLITRTQLGVEPVAAGYHRFFICGGSRYESGGVFGFRRAMFDHVGPFLIREVSEPGGVVGAPIAEINQDEAAVLDVAGHRTVEIIDQSKDRWGRYNHASTMLQLVPMSDNPTKVEVNLLVATGGEPDFHTSGFRGFPSNDVADASVTRTLELGVADSPRLCADKRVVFYRKF